VEEILVTVDATRVRRPISPLIYGVNWADTSTLQDLNAPLNRQGGNSSSRYHWKLNAHAAGADWYFQSLPSEGGAEPGARVHRFVSATHRGAAEAMVTVPMIDWLARLGPGRRKLASFSQARYGAQAAADEAWFADAGNGILQASGAPVTDNDPADAGTPNSPALQREAVAHLVARHGLARRGGVRWYLLDNEPSLWHTTHRDVQPIGATMDDVRRKMIDYARAIKAADPTAQVVGPEEWGWSGYLHSGHDQQWSRAHHWCCTAPDRSAHDRQDYVPWLLAELRMASERHGLRLLDVFSLHCYPEGGVHSQDVSPAMQRLRNRSTRMLWDPDYLDPSWIQERVRLIPRMQEWVAQHFPGLRTAITEYNWGAETHMNGATAQADLLGIFGREGLDLAARWEAPARGTPPYLAMKLFRNHDGRRLSFGDQSLGTEVPDADRLAAFAALREADGALTVMLVHKELGAPARLRLQLSGFPAHAPAQVWQLAGTRTGSTATLSRLPGLSVANDRSVALEVPAQSVTLLVLPRQA
jgi:hypothetical protein